MCESKIHIEYTCGYWGALGLRSSVQTPLNNQLFHSHLECLSQHHTCTFQLLISDPRDKAAALFPMPYRKTPAVTPLFVALSHQRIVIQENSFLHTFQTTSEMPQNFFSKPMREDRPPEGKVVLIRTDV